MILIQETFRCPLSSPPCSVSGWGPSSERDGHNPALMVLPSVVGGHAYTDIALPTLPACPAVIWEEGASLNPDSSPPEGLRTRGGGGGEPKPIYTGSQKPQCPEGSASPISGSAPLAPLLVSQSGSPLPGESHP